MELRLIFSYRINLNSRILYYNQKHIIQHQQKSNPNSQLLHNPQTKISNNNPIINPNRTKQLHILNMIPNRLPVRINLTLQFTIRILLSILQNLKKSPPNFPISPFAHPQYCRNTYVKLSKRLTKGNLYNKKFAHHS